MFAEITMRFRMATVSAPDVEAQYISLLGQYAQRVIAQSGLWIDSSRLAVYREETRALRRKLDRLAAQLASRSPVPEKVFLIEQ